MAVISVRRELRERLGEAATDSLVELLHEFGRDQREELISVVEERFARGVADSDEAVRGEMHTGFKAVRDEMHAGFMGVQKQFLEHQEQIGNLGKEIANVRVDLTEEIANVRVDLTKEIGDARKEIADVRADLTEEIADVRADLTKEIGEVRKEVGEVRKEITVQTRWLLTVLVAATILVPVMQRVLAALFP